MHSALDKIAADRSDHILLSALPQLTMITLGVHLTEGGAVDAMPGTGHSDAGACGRCLTPANHRWRKSRAYRELAAAAAAAAAAALSP